MTKAAQAALRRELHAAFASAKAHGGESTSCRMSYVLGWLMAAATEGGGEKRDALQREFVGLQEGCS